MKVSRVNSSGTALPEAAGAEAVAEAEAAAVSAAALEAAGVSAATEVAAAEVAAAEERIAEADAEEVAVAVPLEAGAEGAAGELLEPPHVATGPPGAV